MINYLLFIATAAIIFVAFRVVRLVSHRIRGLHRYYPVLVALELGLWMAFLFWLVNYLFGGKTYYNALVLVLVITSVVLLVWLYIKDVVAGFLFRIKHNPKTGQIIQTDEAHGVIKEMAPSQVFVEREGGEIIRIPYTRLLGKSLSLKAADTHSASEVILHLDNTDNIDHVELEGRIRLTLLQSPWCVPNKPIKISFLTGTKNGVEITMNLLDRSYADTVKTRLNQLLKS